MSNKELYKQFCKEETDIPVFFQPWWLDIVTHQGSWKVYIDSTEDGKIRGVWPIFDKKKYFLNYSTMPPLTPYLGVYLKYPDNIIKEERKRAFEEKVTKQLLTQMENPFFFVQHFQKDFKTWLPFSWEGYQNSIKLTNIFEDLSDLDKVFSGLKDSLRNKINKAERTVKVLESDDIQRFYELNTKTFNRQGIDIPYSFDFLSKLDEALASRNQRKIYLAEDEQGKTHAGAFVVTDGRYHYLIALGGDTDLRKSGAIPLLIWQAIKNASRENKGFDFEGSVIPQVAGLFRNFGAQQLNYYNIYKSKNKLTNALFTLLGKF